MDVTDLAPSIGPPLIVLLVGEYFALAPKRKVWRLVASAFVFLAAGGVFVFFSLLLAPSCGGHYVP